MPFSRAGGMQRQRIAVVAESEVAARALIADLELGSVAHPFVHNELLHIHTIQMGIRFDTVLFSKSVSPPSDQAIAAFYGHVAPDRMFSVEGDLSDVRAALWLQGNPARPQKMPAHTPPPTGHLIVTPEQMSLRRFRNEADDPDMPLMVLEPDEVKEFDDGWAARNTRGYIEMRPPGSHQWIPRTLLR